MGGERGVDLRHMYFLSSGPPPLNQVMKIGISNLTANLVPKRVVQ